MRGPLLLIGGGGLVGSHLRTHLRDRELVVTSRFAPVPSAIHLDVTDHAALTHLIGSERPDVIVLAAAEANVERCERQPEATRLVNVEPVRVIAEMAGSTGARLVVFSSEYVFDGFKGRYVESDAPGPLNEYGRQKVELEAISRTVPRHLICRTSGVFGWEPARKNFVCQLLDRLRSGREFAVPADQLITPTYAPDLARAVAELIEDDVTGTLHVVGPEILPRPDFARMVCDAFEVDSRLVVGRPTRELGGIAPRPHAAGLADDRLRAALGRPLSPIRGSLEAMRASEAAQVAGLP